MVLATGARWRQDGAGRWHMRAIPGFSGANVLTPDDIMAGKMPANGPVIVFDDDHYYMGGVIAEKLRRAGLDVTLVTPAELASVWTANTLEVKKIQTRLLELGVKIRANTAVDAFHGDHADLACVFTGRKDTMPAHSIVSVTARLPNEALYLALKADLSGLKSVRAIGDCYAPSTIAAAVYAGHEYARSLDEPPPAEVPFRRQLMGEAVG